ncbi:MAG: sulfatase-like hydrolase/transferase [Rikenellaceae bacterium]
MKLIINHFNVKNRYLPILMLGACCVKSVYAETNSNNSSKSELGKPNVIFIYADDMGKGMLSAYGQKYISTPNIDKLIQGGVQFSNCYGAHFSAPARASLLTGYSDCKADIWNNPKGNLIVADTAEVAPIEAILDAMHIKLEEGDDYLAEVFNKAGYVTGEVGKLEYAFASTRSQVKAHGWSYYYGYLDHGACHGFFPPFLYENGEIVMIEGNTMTGCGKEVARVWDESHYDMTGRKQYSQDLFNDKIEAFLETNKDKPFFLYHPTQLPHGPVGVPYVHEQVKYLPNLTDVEKEYATMVILLDEAVGKILKKVEELGIADNTMIVFSNDNGHEIYTESAGRTASYHNVHTGEVIDNYNVRYTTENVGDIFNGNMGMSGKKRGNFDGSINVPLCYYMPSKLTPRVCDEVVANYDFIATMAQLVGVDISEKKTARSYLELLTDKDATLPKERFVIVDSYEGPALMTNDGWKIRYCNVTDKYELYNLDNDYKELNELSGQYPEITEKLSKLMESEVETTMTRGGYLF